MDNARILQFRKHIKKPELEYTILTGRAITVLQYIGKTEIITGIYTQVYYWNSDPLIGEDPVDNPGGFKSTGRFPIEYSNNNNMNFTSQTFDSFIKLKGGEYFFAPSISFLKNLG